MRKTIVAVLCLALMLCATITASPAACESTSALERYREWLNENATPSALERYREWLSENAMPAPTERPIATPQILRDGDEGNFVVLVQRKLIELGFLAEGEDDGIFGLKTKAAVEQFQEEYGLPVTGEISFQAISQALATPSPVLSLAPSPSPVAEDWPVTAHAPDGEDGVDLQLASTIGLCLGAIVCVCIFVERLVAKASKIRFKRPSSDFILHLMVLLISIAAVVWFVADNSSLPDGASYIDALLGLTMCIGCGIVHETIVLPEIIQRGKQK